MLNHKPIVRADIEGSDQYHYIQGIVWLYQTLYGVLVFGNIISLQVRDNCGSTIFAHHINKGNICMGISEDPSSLDDYYNQLKCNFVKKVVCGEVVSL